MPSVAILGGGFRRTTRYEGVGVGLFDLLVNGNRILINSQALRVTKNGN